MKPTYEDLLKFAVSVAALQIEHEPDNDGLPFEQSSEDCFAAHDRTIHEARHLLGLLEICEKCGAEVPWTNSAGECPECDDHHEY